jgi:hypothetical protein
MQILLLIALYAFLALVVGAAAICLLSLIKKVDISPNYQKTLFSSVLLVMASIVFSFVRQGLSPNTSNAYLHGYFYGLIQQSSPQVEDQVDAPVVPPNLEFFKDKHGPDGGQNYYTVSWILAGSGSLDALQCTFQHLYSAPAPPPPPLLGDDKTLAQSAAIGAGSQPVLTQIKKNFSLNLKGFTAANAGGPVVQYKFPSDPSKLGAFYMNGQTAAIPWDDDSAMAARPAPPRSWWEHLTLRPVYAQNSADCSKVQPSAAQSVELINQLGAIDLKTQTAAQQKIVSCGACCIGFLEQATKDPSSALGRERSILMGSLAAVIHQDEANGVKLTDTVYANFGLANYRGGQYKDAVTYLGKLPSSFLAANPQYNFYQAYAHEQMGDHTQAIDGYKAFLGSNASTADRGTIYNNLAIAYSRLGAAAEKAGKAPEAASNYEQAVSNFKLATQNNYKVKEQSTTAAEDGLKRTKK